MGRIPAVSALASTLVIGVAACRAATEEGSKHLLLEPQQTGFETATRPVLLFFVDGLRADRLEELALQGELPRLSRTLLDRSARVRSAVTSVPSVTYANALTMLSGCWPSTHGVWANVCFDRDQLMTRNYEEERGLANWDSASATIFELLPGDVTAAVAIPMDRGAKLSLAGAFDTDAWSAWVAWMLGREKVTDEQLSEQIYEVGRIAGRVGEWPAFTAIHLPGVDNVAHEHGSDGAEYRDAVANLDEAIGGTLEAFAEAGRLEDITVVLTSDHGHHSTPESFAVVDFVEALLDVPVIHAQDNDGGSSFLDRWERYSSALAVVTTCGEREASLHLRTGESWSARPSLEEILAFPAVPGGPVEDALPGRLLRAAAIALVAVRAGENEVHVHGHDGSAAIERSAAGGDPLFTYRIVAGEDPLGYATDDRLARWIEAGAHSSREWLAATAETRHPDLVPQLVITFDHPRSGDVVLFAAPGWDFSEHYLGGHGGIEREELIVPLYIAGPGIRAGAQIEAARLVDLVPTILDLNGAILRVEPHLDGTSFAASLR